ncbi:MAG: class I SAM-dependent methyltransferase [Lutibacter sp.]|nr:class I SAM-dependent methyltransferase [Lutibacter sp.]
MKLLRTIKRKINSYLNFRTSLRIVFKFEKWHVAQFNQKEYAHWIVNELNKKVEKDNVLDIGCGLGDILKRLRYKNKLGIDIDENVIKAARFISKFRNSSYKSRYVCQNIFDVDIQERFNAIIIVNWIHNIESSTLKLLIEKMYHNNLQNEGYIVFDVIERNKDYKYNHDIEFLIADFNSDYNVYGPFEYGRYIVFLRKG